MRKIILHIAVCLCVFVLATMGAAAPEEPVLHQDELALLQSGSFPLDEQVREQTSGIGHLLRFLSGKSAAKEEAKAAIKEGHLALAESIDLRAYSLSANDLKTILQDLINDSPELFHVQMQYKYYLAGDIVDSLVPSYNCTATEYIARRGEYERHLSSLLSQHDESMTQAQTVAFYHDLLASRYAYDTTEPFTYDVYGFLTEGAGVCQAYTLTLKAILSRLGIESGYAQSVAMDHIWNTVLVDGKWYHVDVTWDDPTPDYEGQALHSLLLLSDAAMEKAAHHSWVTSDGVVCTSTQYDGADWASVHAPLAHLGGRVWGFDASSGALTEYDPSTGKSLQTLLTVSDKWSAGEGEVYVQNLSRVVAKGGLLFYTDPDTVFAIDPISGVGKAVYEMTWDEIYDLYSDGETMYCGIASGLGEKLTYGWPKLPEISVPDYTKTVHLYKGNDHFGSFSLVSEAIGALNDPEGDFTIAFSSTKAETVFSVGVLSVPDGSARSLTLKGMHAGTNPILALGRTFETTCDLTLVDMRMISVTRSSELLLGEHCLTLVGASGMGTTAASIAVSGSGGSELRIEGGEQRVHLYAAITVGTFAMSGKISLPGQIRTSTFVLTGESAITFLRAGSSLTSGDLVGAKELTLRSSVDTPPTIGISGICDVSLRYVYRPAYGTATLLTAPELAEEDLTVVTEQSTGDVDVTSLFARSQTGALYLLTPSRMVTNGDVLISYLSVTPSDRVTIPSGIRAVSAYAFIHCPNVVSVTAPSSLETFGPYAMGYVYQGDVPVKHDAFVIRAPKGAPAGAYAMQNGLSCMEYTEEENRDFTYRLYEKEQIVELLTWKGSGSLLLIPETIVSQEGIACTTAVDGDLTMGRTGLSIYAPWVEGSDKNPLASTWEIAHSYYPRGTWYTLTLMLGDAVFFSAPLPVGTDPSTAIKIPDRPTAEGVSYRFAGWDGDGDGEPDEVPTAPEGDLTLVAVFEELRDRFLVSWYDADGKLLFDQAFEAGTVIVPPADPFKVPDVQFVYRFSHWEGYVAGMIAQEDVSFRAVYSVQARTYQIVFLDDAGNTVSEMTLPFGAVIEAPIAPEKPQDEAFAYAFSHWEGYADGMSVSGDATFVAVYLKTDLSGLYPSDITSAVYAIGGGKIFGIAPGTTVSALLGALDQAEYLVVTGKDGGALSEQTTLASGMLVTLVGAGGSVIKQVTIVVSGDISGDGVVSVTDFVNLKAHLLRISPLTGVGESAADLNGDGSVTLTDFILLKAILLRVAG